MCAKVWKGKQINIGLDDEWNHRNGLEKANAAAALKHHLELCNDVCSKQASERMKAKKAAISF